MKRFRFYFTQAFMAVLMVAAFSCSKDDPDNPNNAVPDPEGTITANISESTSVTFFGSNVGVWIKWISPDNIYISTTALDPGNRFSSICDMGKMKGLGNITHIPNSGFTQPSVSNNIACEKGHGYVIKGENKGMNDTFYVRLYVVEPIISTSGGIMGAKVKYQYPFVP